MPFIVTLLEPLVAWNPDPLIVNCVPITPLDGVMVVMCGVGTVKKIFVLLVMPPEITLTAPLLAVEGTTATICESDQLIIEVAGTELNLMLLLPCVAPKPLPLTCT